MTQLRGSSAGSSAAAVADNENDNSIVVASSGSGHGRAQLCGAIPLAAIIRTEHVPRATISDEGLCKARGLNQEPMQELIPGFGCELASSSAPVYFLLSGCLFVYYTW